MSKRDLSRKGLARTAARCKADAVRRLLTKRHCADKPPYLSKVFRARATAARRRFREANLLGVGYGSKESDGTLTGDLAIRVYVTKKMPLAGIPKRYRVPKEINGTATDVVPIARPMHQARPAPPGSSISHATGGRGTLGAIVERPNDNKYYLLSAAHVLAPDNQAQPGDAILEPAGAAVDPIATLTEYEPLDFDGGPNVMDAGIARVARKSDVRLPIPRIGAINPRPMEVYLYQSTRKTGSSTRHTLGVVTDVSADLEFLVDGESILYVDAVQIMGCGGDFSAGGDSGSVVIDAVRDRPIALLFGGAGVRSYCAPIEPILARFQVQFAS